MSIYNRSLKYQTDWRYASLVLSSGGLSTALSEHSVGLLRRTVRQRDGLQVLIANYVQDGQQPVGTLSLRVMEALEETVRVVTSKPVQRAVINTALLTSSAAILFCLAAIATGLFFQNFVPDQYVTTPVHLQYGLSPHPYGITSLTRPPPMMKTHQEYDLSVRLSLPRSPANLEPGNFMVTLHLLGSEVSEQLEADARVFANTRSKLAGHKIMFTSRRPALVPYIDPILSVSKRLVLLLYHLITPHSQTCKLSVTMAERLPINRATQLPSSAYVEIEAGQRIQIYDAALTMTARLRGLRWLMFHYRLPTYIAFTFLFWGCEVLFMGLAWAAWEVIIMPNTNTATKRRRLKVAPYEEGELTEFSNYPQTFPTYGTQPPLKHEPAFKQEDFEERVPRMLDVLMKADDQDDSGDVETSARRRYDSGIGTSFGEEGSGNMRRRALRNIMH